MCPSASGPWPGSEVHPRGASPARRGARRHDRLPHRAGRAVQPRPSDLARQGRIDAAKLGKSGSCHLFRHTMATLMHENGADIRYIQEMLGHGRLETTQIYTHVAIRTLQQVHAATHPAAMPTRPKSAVPHAQRLGGDDLFAALHAEAEEEPE